MLETKNSLISQFDYVISHFDGNNNDKDDIAALPMAALLTNSAGLEDKSTFFYGNNLGEPNNTSQVEAMRKSAAFAEKLGIKTYDYQTNTNAATDELVKILNSGKQVLAIEGGPMEAIYRGLEKINPSDRKNVTLLSHSSWNENRDVASKPGVTDVRTWSDIKKDFPEVKLIEIDDQNDGNNNKSGFNNTDWKWLDNTNEPLLKEARILMKNADGKVNDPSDSGMHFYAITGNEDADPNDAKAFFQANPPSVDGTSNPPSKPPSNPTPPPTSAPDTKDKVYLADNGQVVIEAESTNLEGDWKKVEVDGRDGVLYDGANSFNKVPQGQTLEYKFETDEGGKYNIALHSARDKSAMGEFRNDLGNDAFVSIENVETGEVIQQPTKLFTSFGNINGEYRWGTTFDAEGKKSPAQVELDPNTEYSLKIDGRSDGYVIDKITLSNDGFLKNADADPSKIKGKDSVPTPQPKPEPEPGNNSPLSFEAEDMKLSGEYRVESINAASGNKVISLRGGKTEGTGEAGFKFNGDSGKYNIKVNYFDENDGVGNLTLKQGSKELVSIDLDKELGSFLADDKTLTTQEIKGVEIKAGDKFTLQGVEDGTSKTAEHARIDNIEFIPVDGINPTSNNSSNSKEDVLLGTNKADTFMLGDTNTSFYNDGQDNTLGADSYALIRNFNSQQGDVIQLAGKASDYTLGASSQGLPEGKSIFLKTPGQDELVGIVQGASNLNLNSNSFKFI